MTSTSIQGMKDVMSMVQPKIGEQNQNASLFADNLQQAMTKKETLATDKRMENRADNSERDKAAKLDSSSTVNKKSEKLSNAEEKTKQNISTDKTAETEYTDVEENADTTMPEVIGDACEQIKEMLSKLLQVSEEDIEKAMEQLGIESIGLLMPNNFAQMVLQVSGEADMMAVVTNESLYQTLQDGLAGLEQIQAKLGEELQMSPEQMESLLGKLQENAASQMPEGIVVDSEMDGAVKTPLENPLGQQNVESGNENLVAMQQQGNRDSANQDGETQKNPFAKTEQSEIGQQAIQSQGQNILTQGLLEHINQPFENQLTNLVEGEEVQLTTSPQEIANQILDYMKVQMNQEMTELEMQLHPASLGTVNVSLQSREGNLTAQFTAQNELVKGVIESQLVQLREQLEQQGLKVDAVEVAVSNHQFDRSFSNQQEQAGQQQPKKKGTRRIQLDQFDADIENLDEASKITVQMMEQNGNTVDFTA